MSFRFTPERQPELTGKSAKSRLGGTPEPPNTGSSLEDANVDVSEQTNRKASKYELPKFYYALKKLSKTFCRQSYDDFVTWSLRLSVSIYNLILQGKN